MFSLILSQADSNEVSLSGLKHVAILQMSLEPNLFAVHPHARLLDEAAGVAAAAGQAGFEQRFDDVRIADRLFRHLIRNIALAELHVEVLLGVSGGLVAVHPR